MRNNLFDLIHSRITLTENSRHEFFNSICLYSETLPSLLTQCTGFIEKKINKFLKDICTDELTSLKPDKIKTVLKKFKINDKKVDCNFFLIKSEKEIRIQLLTEYEKIFENCPTHIKVDVNAAVNKILLNNKKDIHEFISTELNRLTNHRDNFAHGHINERPLTIISIADYFVYYGILVLIDAEVNKFIDMYESQEIIIVT